MTRKDVFEARCLWRRFNQSVVSLGVFMKLNNVPDNHPARVKLRDVLVAINAEQEKLGDLLPIVGDMAPAAPEAGK